MIWIWLAKKFAQETASDAPCHPPPYPADDSIWPSLYGPDIAYQSGQHVKE
jgi:hypothetical protein